MHLSSYLGLLQSGCATLANSYRQVAEGHSEEADVRRTCQRFASQCDHHGQQLRGAGVTAAVAQDPDEGRCSAGTVGGRLRGPAAVSSGQKWAMRWTTQSEEGPCLLQMSSS